MHTPEPSAAAVTPATQTKMDQAMTQLWETKKSAAKAKAKATGGRRRKIVTEEPRLHALDGMRCLDNSMRNGLRRRLHEFNEQELASTAWAFAMARQ